MEATTKPSLDPRVSELIALLDQYNHLKGNTLFTHPDHPSPTLPPLPTDGTPVAIQMYTTPSLSTHLAAHNIDLQTQRTLAETIRHHLTTHPGAHAGAHDLLNAQYNLLPEKPKAMNTATFTQLPNLPEKLATLRLSQHNASEAQTQRPPEFITNLVADIDAAGRPDPLLQIWLPVATDWYSYTQALAVNTYHKWTDDDGDGDGDAPTLSPEIDTLKDGGGWVYQRTSNSGQAENKLHELKCEEDYDGMRNGATGEWENGALVWHVSWNNLMFLLPNKRRPMADSDFLDTNLASFASCTTGGEGGEGVQGRFQRR